MTTATGTSKSRSLADRAAEWINVKDYGAIGNDVTDDSTAISNAIAAARANQSTGVTLYFPPGTYRVNSGLNFTGFTTTNKTVKVVGYGAVIDSHNTGGVAIDATGSKHYAIYGLTLHGDGTDTPAIGWQMGRISTSGTDACPQSRFYNFSLYGSFSSEAVLNVACEEVWWDALNINNAYSGGKGLVQDGLNHFNLSSAFVTVTLPVDTAESFLDDRFVGLVVQVIAAPPVWIANTSHHQFNGYVSSTAGNAGLWSYQSAGGDNNISVVWNVHTETNPTDIILITGANTSGKLIDFFFQDANPQFTNSIFKLDTGYTAAAIHGLDLHVGVNSGGGTKVFDSPTSWSVAGRATFVNGSTLWNLTDAQFGGCVVVGFGVPQCNERTSAQDAVTAHAGGGQGSATAITSNVATVTVAANPNDSVKLKATSSTTTGICQTIANATSNSVQVFGTSPDTINGVATGTGVALPAGQTGRWCSTVAGAWFGGFLNAVSIPASSSLVVAGAGPTTVNLPTGWTHLHYELVGGAGGSGCGIVEPNLTATSGGATGGAGFLVIGDILASEVGNVSSLVATPATAGSSCTASGTTNGSTGSATTAGGNSTIVINGVTITAFGGGAGASGGSGTASGGGGSGGQYGAGGNGSITGGSAGSRNGQAGTTGAGNSATIYGGAGGGAGTALSGAGNSGGTATYGAAAGASGGGIDGSGTAQIGGTALGSNFGSNAGGGAISCSANSQNGTNASAPTNALFGNGGGGGASCTATTGGKGGNCAGYGSSGGGGGSAETGQLAGSGGTSCGGAIRLVVSDNIALVMDKLAA